MEGGSGRPGSLRLPLHELKSRFPPSPQQQPFGVSPYREERQREVRRTGVGGWKLQAKEKQPKAKERSSAQERTNDRFPWVSTPQGKSVTASSSTFRSKAHSECISVYVMMTFFSHQNREKA